MMVVDKILIITVRGYQLLLSPILGPSCRFHPSCSSYSVGSIRRHGTLKGLYLTAARILRCHPWAKWGEDPVPKEFTFRPWTRMNTPAMNADFEGNSSFNNDKCPRAAALRAKEQH